MGKNFEDYHIRICTVEDRSSLTNFIHTYWKPNHILAASTELLDWQHFDKSKQRYNFVLAQDLKTREIHGILGFISPQHFDPEINARDIWLTTWMVRQEVARVGLGLALYHFLEKELQPRSIATVGLNQTSIPFYKYLGFRMGKLKQYFILNKECLEYGLLEGVEKLPAKPSLSPSNKKFIKMDHSSEGQEVPHSLFERSIPEKSWGYIIGRYLDHPIYQYQVYGIAQEGEFQALAVVRRASFNGQHALRVVDLIGPWEALEGTHHLWQGLLKSHQAQYLDLYCLDAQDLDPEAAGFFLRDEYPEVIVPNYFEPFEKRNVDLHYSYNISSGESYSIFKGDCDQDRPNFISQEASA